MTRTYNSAKNLVMGNMQKIRDWTFDEPNLMAAHPLYEFFISEVSEAYSFFVIPSCSDKAKFVKARSSFGLTTEEIVMRGRLGLSGNGRSVRELDTLLITPTASTLESEDTELLLNRFAPLVFQEYKKLYPRLVQQRRNGFY